MLARMGRKWGSHTVLLGAQNRVPTLERAGSSSNDEAQVSIGPGSTTPKYIPKRKEGTCSHKMSLLMLVELLIRAKKYLHVMD